MARNDLKGKVVVVAGGAKALGGLLSREFASKGAKVAIHYNSENTKDEAKKTLEEITNSGGEAFLFQADLTKVENIKKLFEVTKDKFGEIDIAVNTVGMVLKKSFLETSEEEYDTMFDINSKVAYFFIQEAGKVMNDNGKICTIVTSLLAAYAGLYSTYAGAKAPVEHFTRMASKEFGDRGISSDCRSSWPDGYTIFLWTRNSRRGCLSQICISARRSHQDRRHCIIGRILGY